ncbi:hypothetical protein ACLB2K_050629 [Fragaria x ananassa]
MGDPFLFLLKTRCFTFSSSSSSLLPSHRRFLPNKLRPWSSLRLPTPRAETTTLPHSSTSQFDLISTTECLDGSVVFRFGDESEKAAFDDANKILVEESNVEGSEVEASPASSPEENAVLEFTTAVLGDNSLSTESQDVSTEGESQSRDVSGVSAPRKLEFHTLERSEGYPSTISGDELIEGDTQRKYDMRGSTPMPVELHTSEGSEGYPSTKAEDELTEGKEDRLDVIGASTPTPVESHASEGSEGYPSTKSEDELTEGTGDRTDVTGVSTPTPVELPTSEGTEGYPSTKSEDEVTKGKEYRRDVTGASTPTPVELHKTEGSKGYPSTRSEEELTGDKEDRTDVTGASTPRTVRVHTVEGSQGYPSMKSEDEFTEGKAHQRDVSGASIDSTEDIHTVEAIEENASIISADEFADDKTHRRDASGELVPRIVELHSVEGAKRKGIPVTKSDAQSTMVEEKRDASIASTSITVESHTVEDAKGKGISVTKSEDQSTMGEEQRDASRASTPITVESHTVEGAQGYGSIKLEDNFAEGKLVRIDVLEGATPRTVELHRAECAEDTPSKKPEDEFTEDRAHRRNVSEASTPTVVELHTVEGTEGEDISAPLLLLSTGAASLPHPSKALTGGEDVYFVASGNWLGVADGVSQWSLEGINPGVYASELMENCERFLSDCKGISLTKPEDILVRAAAQTKSPGSSTVLIAYFDGQAFHVANIGNSGFIIIRNGAVFKRSSPLIHGFNFPLQIVRGVDPSELMERYSIDLDEGDVIVTATDGLFDNLYEQEITSIVTKSFQKRMKLQDIAKFLATSAQEVGQSTSRRSPFADAVEASGYVGYTGGKLDDVTVIVSHVHKKCSCYSL